MSITPTYPGIYIEEVPSGVRTITGVATSIAVFVGWSKKGPTEKAERMLSWQDFERWYGGLGHCTPVQVRQEKLETTPNTVA